MKLLRCYKCGRSLLIPSDNADRLNIKVNCRYCGNNDYIHSFLSGGPAEINETAKTVLDSSFFRIITDLASTPATIGLDGAIREISGHYHLSPITIVSIINRLRNQNLTDTRYNPTRFIKIIPGKVSADTILEEIKKDVARALRSSDTESQSPASVSTYSTQWKKLYDEKCEEITALQREYDSLLENARRLKNDNIELEKILNNR